MDRGKREFASNGEEKMGSFKKEDGHLFFSILPIMFSESIERGEKWMEIREMFSGGRQRGESWERRKRKEMKDERG